MSIRILLESAGMAGKESTGRVSPIRTVLLLVLIQAISASAASLDGSVFIVKKSGESVKLALAEVYLLDGTDLRAIDAAEKAREEAIRDRVEQQKAVWEGDLKRMQSSIHQQELELAAAEYELQVESRKRQEAIEAMSLPPPKRRAFKNEADYENAIAELEAKRRAGNTGPASARVQALKASIAGLRENIAHLEEMARRLDPQKLFQLEFQVRPPPGKKIAARADADGRFTVRVTNEEKILIVAHRELPPERYVWFLDLAELAAEPTPILFSNHNLVSGL